MKVTYKYLVHSGYDIFQFPYPHSFYLPVYFLAFLCELLLAGFPLHPELPVPTFGTVVCKSEECKGLRFPLSFSPPVFLRKSPEFYQAALLFLQAQSKVLHSAFQQFIKFFLRHLCTESTLQSRPHYAEVGIVRTIPKLKLCRRILSSIRKIYTFH